MLDIENNKYYGTRKGISTPREEGTQPKIINDLINSLLNEVNKAKENSYIFRELVNKLSIIESKICDKKEEEIIRQGITTDLQKLLIELSKVNNNNDEILNHFKSLI